MHPPGPRGTGGPPDPRDLPPVHAAPGPTPGPPVPPAPPGGPPGGPPAPPPHLMFPHSPLMMPPGIPLPMGGVPPALLPGALALHHAAVAGAAAGAAAAAEEARKAHERSLAGGGALGPHDGAPHLPPGVPLERAGRGGGGPRGPSGKRHNAERSGGNWRRLPKEERLSRMHMQQQQRGRSDWRGTGGSSRDKHSAGSRWRGSGGGGHQGEGAGAPMKRSRAALRGFRGPSGPPGGISGASSDSELSLMSVASQEQEQQQQQQQRKREQQEDHQQGRRSPSVEMLQQHGGHLAPGEGMKGALTPISSLSGSESDLSLSAASASSEKGGPPEGVGGPSDGIGGGPADGFGGTREGFGGTREGFGGPHESFRASSEGFGPSPEGFGPPPGLVGGEADVGYIGERTRDVVGSGVERRSNNNTSNNNTSSSSNRRGGGQFLFDLWVPTTFHPGGKEAAKVLLGVRGCMHKELQKAAGAHVQLYGKELKRNTNKHEYDAFRDNQPLHLVVSTDRHRNPNPSPREQLQIVHRLQHMLESLVRDSWPSTAPHPPPSFYDKQRCLGPSTGPLVEVNPLDGSCRVRTGPPNTPSSTAPPPSAATAAATAAGAPPTAPAANAAAAATGAAAAPGSEAATTQQQQDDDARGGGGSRGPSRLHSHGSDPLTAVGPPGGGPTVTQPFQGGPQGGPLPSSSDTRNPDGTTGTPNSFSQHAAAAAAAGSQQQPLGLQQQQMQQQLQQQLQQQPQAEGVAARGAPCGPWVQPDTSLSPTAGHTEIRYQGDPLLLLDVPPSLCLLLLTLQGLHALLAEEGPCLSSALPLRFQHKWGAPWGPFNTADESRGGTNSNPTDNNTHNSFTVASVKTPQFRAVAARMRQLLAA
ncbi:hypothetical protein, conserved [Eimeria maxima]|uniref:KH domain-containing protein n=1 Tax=Eimeria maxima TaxID=5804 RepID=U6M9R0_EIMMA|nr:hypothetical protein, conserved [Eimeria maxima]CDJ60952.1 hypothetical protein, conserved [Eimeria maxima]